MAILYGIWRVGDKVIFQEVTIPIDSIINYVDNIYNQWGQKDQHTQKQQDTNTDNDRIKDTKSSRRYEMEHTYEHPNILMRNCMFKDNQYQGRGVDHNSTENLKVVDLKGKRKINTQDNNNHALSIQGIYQKNKAKGSTFSKGRIMLQGDFSNESKHDKGSMKNIARKKEGNHIMTNYHINIRDDKDNNTQGKKKEDNISTCLCTRKQSIGNNDQHLCNGQQENNYKTGVKNNTSKR